MTAPFWHVSLTKKFECQITSQSRMKTAVFYFTRFSKVIQLFGGFWNCPNHFIKSLMCQKFFGMFLWQGSLNANQLPFLKYIYKWKALIRWKIKNFCIHVLKSCDSTFRLIQFHTKVNPVHIATTLWLLLHLTAFPSQAWQSIELKIHLK